MTVTLKSVNQQKLTKPARPRFRDSCTQKVQAHTWQVSKGGFHNGCPDACCYLHRCRGHCHYRCRCVYTQLSVVATFALLPQPERCFTFSLFVNNLPRAPWCVWLLRQHLQLFASACSTASDTCLQAVKIQH